MRPPLDLSWQKFGKLVAICYFSHDKPSQGKTPQRTWWCVCECGNFSIRKAWYLSSRRNRPLSCGCSGHCTRNSAPTNSDGRHICWKCGLRPILPHYEKKAPNSGWCSKCISANKSVKRSTRWAQGERPSCKNHPLNVVNRARWVGGGDRLCGSCCHNNEGAKRRKRNRYHRQMQDPEFVESKKYKDCSWRKTKKMRNQGAY